MNKLLIFLQYQLIICISFFLFYIPIPLGSYIIEYWVNLDQPLTACHQTRLLKPRHLLLFPFLTTSKKSCWTVASGTQQFWLQRTFGGHLAQFPPWNRANLDQVINFTWNWCWILGVKRGKDPKILGILAEAEWERVFRSAKYIDFFKTYFSHAAPSILHRSSTWR